MLTFLVAGNDPPSEAVPMHSDPSLIDDSRRETKKKKKMEEKKTPF
jgi:hypothetical protein